MNCFIHYYHKDLRLYILYKTYIYVLGSSDTQSIVIPKYSSIEVEEAKKLRRTPNVKLIQFLDKYRGIYSIANYSRLPLAIGMNHNNLTTCVYMDNAKLDKSEPIFT